MRSIRRRQKSIKDKLSSYKAKTKYQKRRRNRCSSAIKRQNKVRNKKAEIKKGERIELTVFSSKEIQRDDKDFVAGIIDETGKERYVMHAVDIIHDFYVKKDGKYKVFVENRYKKKIKIGIAICVEE